MPKGKKWEIVSVLAQKVDYNNRTWIYYSESDNRERLDEDGGRLEQIRKIRGRMKN